MNMGLKSLTKGIRGLERAADSFCAEDDSYTVLH